MPKPTKPKRGRPRLNIDWQGLGVRFLPEEKSMIEKASKKVGESQADFVRKGAVDRASKVLY